MSWSKSHRALGVFKVEGKSIKIYGTPSSYSTLNVGEEINRADWNGDNLQVSLKNGKVRIYKSNGSYNTI